MRNREIRKPNPTAVSQQKHTQVNCLNAGRTENGTWQRSSDEDNCEYIHEDEALAQTPETDDSDDGDSDNDSEGELSLGTCSSFSLQECIDEFKARRIRRVSHQSRDLVVEKKKDCVPKSNLPDLGEADPINQNRTNKEHERKCKPCKNGFCYCFTSDSGDAVAVAVPGQIARPHRRARKSEGSQASYAAHPRCTMTRPVEKRRQSAPPILKESVRSTRSACKSKAASSCNDLKAISCLKTSDKNAPLIHIIQELRNNCVISEVRINKDKIKSRRCHSLSSKPSPRKTHFELSENRTENEKKRFSLPSKTFSKIPTPSAPALDKISELDSLSEPFIYSSSLDTSAKSRSSNGRRHKAAGLLLQKRLSNTPMQFKPRDLNEPPPKPPRSNGFINGDKPASLSTLASTTPSVREAERVVDKFLQSKGIATSAIGSKKTTKNTEQRNSKMQTQSKDKKELVNAKAKKQLEKERYTTKLSGGIASNRNKSKSYPLIQSKTTPNNKKTLPTYPSLSPFARMMEKDIQLPATATATANRKNIRPTAEKLVKHHNLGWKEPELVESLSIHQMLNYDSNANKRQFRSQAVQAEPQAIGWQIPPKVALDTVDSSFRQNLDANISQKVTPVKKPTPTAPFLHDESVSQKYIFRNQFKNLMNSSWSNKAFGAASGDKPKSSLKTSSQAFFNDSKKRILRLVSPKVDNREQRAPFVARKTALRSVGVQTSKAEMPMLDSSSTPQSPPGSYFSAAMQTSHRSTTPSNETQEAPAAMHFNFDRTVNSPPKKTKEVARGKLNFPLSLDDTRNGSPDAKTYRSFQSELDQDVTLSKMGVILSNIRAKLEASDERAERTFREIGQREQLFAAGLDCIDAEQRLRHKSRSDMQRKHRHFVIDEKEEEPIYSEIEEESFHILSKPHIENKTGNTEHFSGDQDPSALYAKVDKRTKQAKSSAIATDPQQSQQMQQQQLQGQYHEEEKPSSYKQHAQKQQEMQQHQKKKEILKNPSQNEPQQGKNHRQQIENDHRQQKISEQKQQQQKQRQQEQQNSPRIEPPKPQQQKQQLLSPKARLAKCFQEALKSKISLRHSSPLKPKSKPKPTATTTTAKAAAAFHASPPSSSSSKTTSSLNNICVQEQDSPPKRNRHLSKSDLSLHRSEIFLENLCRSEIIINDASNSTPSEKISNTNLDASFMSGDSRAGGANLSSQYEGNNDPTAAVDEIDGGDKGEGAAYYTNVELNESVDADHYDDDVSYELPDDEAAHTDLSQNTADSRYAVNQIRPLTKQSTPKKSQTKQQTFTTKDFFERAALPAEQQQQQLNADIQQRNLCPSNAELPVEKQPQQQQKDSLDINKPCLLSLPLPQHLSHSNSCPNTPRALPPIPGDGESHVCASSLIEVPASFSEDATQQICCKPTLARYQRLKNALRMSLRRSKKFVKSESKRLSSSLIFPAAAAAAATSFSNKSNHNQSHNSSSSPMFIDSTISLDFLFRLDDDDQPLEQQLATAVCICRQIPDLEISPEMVEAERLLLFSTLRREAAKWPTIPGVDSPRPSEQQQPHGGCIYVDAMRIPVRTDASQDLFFNYFYICTFYCGGVIRSTQSAECRNHEAIFIDCGIELVAADSEAEVNCEIFMLRLRKVSTISAERTRKSLLNLSRSSMASSCEDIVSRFRLHGSFTIRASDFRPFEYVEQPSQSSRSLCLRSSTNCRIAITPRTASTNLAHEALLTGRADMRFPKLAHSGFLNVQQPENQHHWNRRWCTLDGMVVRVWHDVLDEEICEPAPQPLLQFDLCLRSEATPLESAAPELCPRPRSFCLDCCVLESETEDDTKATTSVRSVFFAAETQNDLSTWLVKLNEVLSFIAKWMK